MSTTDFISFPLFGSTFFVVQDGGSIQAAIDEAGAGDTVVVPRGDFVGNLEIPAGKDGLTIVGAKTGVSGDDASRDLTGGAGESSVEGRLVILSDGVTVDGMRFVEGSDGGAFELAGIHVQAANATVTNSVLYRSGDIDGDTSRAIINSVGNGDGLTVADNVMTGWHTGTYVQGASNVVVSGNSYVNNFVGVSADAYPVGNADLQVTGNTFDNELEDMGVGAVGASWDTTNAVEDNTFHKGFYDYDPATNDLLGSNNTFVPGDVRIQGEETVYTSIQEAIDNAVDGDTIVAGAGTYDGFTVDKDDLTIEGPNAALAGSDDGRGDEAVVEGNVVIEGDGVALRGFEVSPPAPTENEEGEAVRVAGTADNVTVENNIVRDIDGGDLPQWEGMEGIVAFGGDGSDAVSNVAIRDNLVENINGRAFDGGAAGIRVQGNVDGADVEDNVVRNIGEGETAWAFGIAVSGTGNHDETPANVSLDGNTIEDIESDPATPTVGVGIGLESPSDAVTVENNSVSNADFVIEDKDADGTTLSVTELEQIIDDNTFDKGVYVTNEDGSIDTTSSDAVILFSSIQAAVDSAEAGDTINVLSGTYEESVTVDKAVDFVGAGVGETIVTAPNGSAFDIQGDLGTDASISIDGFDVRESAAAGVDFDDDAVLGTLTITNSNFEANADYGVGIGGDPNPVDLDNVEITNSTFTGNGEPRESNGDGDILFFQYNGDATLENVTIFGQDRGNGPGENGIQFRSDTGALGTVALDNVDISGEYEKTGLAFYRYDSIADLSADNVSITAETDLGLPVNFDGIGGPIDFTALDIDVTGATGAVALQGDNGGNTIVSGGEDAFLRGGGGADSITGGGGQDTVFGGARGDAVIALEDDGSFTLNGEDDVAGVEAIGFVDETTLATPDTIADQTVAESDSFSLDLADEMGLESADFDFTIAESADWLIADDDTGAVLKQGDDGAAGDATTVDVTARETATGLEITDSFEVTVTEDATPSDPDPLDGVSLRVDNTSSWQQGGVVNIYLQNNTGATLTDVDDLSLELDDPVAGIIDVVTEAGRAPWGLSFEDGRFEVDPWNGSDPHQDIDDGSEALLGGFVFEHDEGGIVTLDNDDLSVVAPETDPGGGDGGPGDPPEGPTPLDNVSVQVEELSSWNWGGGSGGVVNISLTNNGNSPITGVDDLEFSFTGSDAINVRPNEQWGVADDDDDGRFEVNPWSSGNPHADIAAGETLLIGGFTYDDVNPGSLVTLDGEDFSFFREDAVA